MPAQVKTTEEQLIEVQTAITEVLSGQEAEINGRKLKRADLQYLNEREEQLLSRYRKEQGNRAIMSGFDLRNNF